MSIYLPYACGLCGSHEMIESEDGSDYCGQCGAIPEDWEGSPAPDEFDSLAEHEAQLSEYDRGYDSQLHFPTL